MAAPRKPNTGPATAAVRRKGDETAAKRLRAHGWIVVPPEHAGAVPPELNGLFGQVSIKEKDA